MRPIGSGGRVKGFTLLELVLVLALILILWAVWQSKRQSPELKALSNE